MEGVGWLGYLYGTDSTSTFKLLFVPELLNLEPLRSACHAHLHTFHTHQTPPLCGPGGADGGQAPPRKLATNNSLFLAFKVNLPLGLFPPL